MPDTGLPNVDDLDRLEQDIALEAPNIDEGATFPEASVAKLATAGLLTWPLAKSGNIQSEAGAVKLRDLLVRVGRASLTVGRLFEGHVNAATLIHAYGDDGNRELALAEASAGRLTGVWNAERDQPLIAQRCGGGWRLSGQKVFCSGAGSISRPIVTARLNFTRHMLMMMPTIEKSQVDLSRWRAVGMRGTATGIVHFDGVFVPDSHVVGKPGDYGRSPLFAGGAWRVLAVQLGGLQSIANLHAQQLNGWSAHNNCSARARFASVTQNLELARLLVNEACCRANDPDQDPAAVDAYVDAARNALENLALSIVKDTRRNIGLSTFIAPHPLDLVIRDIETYLRQPFLDSSQDNAAKWLLQRKGRFDHD